MEQLIDFYARKTIQQNEGYRFAKIENVYLPVIQVHLNVTKRDYFSLPFLDEIVLRLLDEGVHEVTELSNILGVERNVLDVTIADLYVRDMIYCKSDHCSLMAKGRAALQELSYTQRSKECLKNIYLDPLNKTILIEYGQLEFCDRSMDNDKKLSADFEKGDLDVFKKNFEDVRHIFEEEMSNYQDNTKMKPSELLSIDGIEKVSPKFVKLSIAIFVSKSGYDIDIVAADRKTEKFLAKYKAEIISQILSRRILKKVFTKYRLKRHYETAGYPENTVLAELSRKYYRTAEDSDEREEIRQAIEQEVFSNRKLKDAEFDYLFPILCKNAESFVISVDRLDDWCHGNDFFIMVLSRIGGKKVKQINYAYSDNLSVCIGNINRTISITADRFQQEQGLPYFSLQTDTGWRIRIIPEDIPVLDSDTHIYRYEYVLEQV